jgi:hypothetical protein
LGSKDDCHDVYLKKQNAAPNLLYIHWHSKK